MSILISFLSGLISAFTPCVIVLIPLILYRFFHENFKDYKNFIYFIFGYLLFYIIFGYLLKNILTSQIQNGFKLGIGLIFVILGILAIFNKLNPLSFPVIKNPFLLGLSFAIIVSFNPCSIPYLSIIFSLNQFQIFINLLFFGLGSIIPAIIFTIFGKSLFSISKYSGKYIDKINKLMHYILLFSGIYIIYTIHNFSKYDIFVITLFLAIIFFIIIKTFFIINKLNDLIKLKNILLLLSLILILFIAITHCSYQLDENKKYNILFNNQINNDQNKIYSCSSNVLECSVCKNCIYKFIFATLLGLISIFLFNFNYKTYNKKIKLNFKKNEKIK